MEYIDKSEALASFSEVYQKYRGPFTRMAISYVGDKSIAEDFVTDSFVAYWENRSRLPQGTNIPAYILVSLKNKCLTYLTHLRKEQEIIDSMKSQYQWELDFQIASLEACNPQEIFSEEVWRLVNEAIRSLPDKTKEIFLLSRMENLTNREIAEQLDISIKTVEFHIGRALKAMRVALKDYLPLFFLLFVK